MNIYITAFGIIIFLAGLYMMYRCIKGIIDCNRRLKRIDKAYELHQKVLNEYGIEAALHMTPMHDIINDTKEITIVNYLNTDFIKIK